MMVKLTRKYQTQMGVPYFTKIYVFGNFDNEIKSLVASILAYVFSKLLYSICDDSLKHLPFHHSVCVKLSWQIKVNLD